MALFRDDLKILTKKLCDYYTNCMIGECEYDSEYDEEIKKQILDLL